MKRFPFERIQQSVFPNLGLQVLGVLHIHLDHVVKIVPGRPEILYSRNHDLMRTIGLITLLAAATGSE